MNETKAKKIMETLLAPMDIRIDGERPWDIRVKAPDFYQRVLSGGSLALGESYMEGIWDCDALDRFFEIILTNRMDQRIKAMGGKVIWDLITARMTNLQSRARPLSSAGGIMTPATNCFPSCWT
nr:hypothetical protein [Desulfobacula sp.]